MTLYPAFLDLSRREVVLVGGGTVAAGKLDGLLAAGARVTVVAPAISEIIRARASAAGSIDPNAIRARAAGRARGVHEAAAAITSERETSTGSITLVERGFEPTDLDRAWWVVAAATPDVNAAVATAAEARRVFVNAVDDKAAATAFLGGVVRRGPVEIAISTGGAAPALAGLLREGLDALLPQELERWVAVAIATRADWKAAHVPIGERRPLLLRALQELYATKGSGSVATKAAAKEKA